MEAHQTILELTPTTAKLLHLEVDSDYQIVSIFQMVVRRIVMSLMVTRQKVKTLLAKTISVSPAAAA